MAGADLLSLALEPRSLLVFSAAAYTEHMHGIAAEKSEEVGAAAPCVNLAFTACKQGDVVHSHALAFDAQ